MLEVIACSDLVNKISKIPFWKREKEWKRLYEKKVVEEIVKPINEMINRVNAEDL